MKIKTLTFKESKIETLIGLSDEDKINLYSVEEITPKLEDLPKEKLVKNLLYL